MVVIGIVYFIKEENGYIKIGHTNGDVYNRLKQLQTANPRKLSVVRILEIENSQALERSFHEIFKDERICGEWFDISESDVDECFSILKEILPEKINNSFSATGNFFVDTKDETTKIFWGEGLTKFLMDFKNPKVALSDEDGIHISFSNNTGNELMVSIGFDRHVDWGISLYIK